MSAPYYLAVDVRADTTTAAVAVGSQLDAIRTARGLPHAGTMPTAVFVGADDLVFGEGALARGLAEPDRLIGDFVSSVGDPAAMIVVDGEEFSPADLYAWMVDAVVTRVAQLQGGPARAVWAVVPVSWGDERIDALADAMDRDGHPDIDFISASEALASRYWQVEPFDVESTLLVCDVDDRELTAEVVRATPTGRSRPIGTPAVAPLLRDGAEDADLERHAVDSVAAAAAQAGVDVDDLDAIILGGVPGRVGRIEQLLVDRFGDPIGTDPLPALATALGAAFALAHEDISARARRAPVIAGGSPATTSEGTRSAGSTGRRSAARPWYRRPVGILGVALGAAMLAGGAFASASVLGASASAGGSAVTPSPSPSAETTADAAPRPTPTPSASAAPRPTTTPVAALPAPPPPEVESPQAPANPRVPNSSAPRAPAAPITAPAPPPAPAAPVEAEPTGPATPEPDLTEPEPTAPEPTGTDEPMAPDPTPDPDPTETPNPESTAAPESSPGATPAPTGDGEPPVAP